MTLKNSPDDARVRGLYESVVSKIVPASPTMEFDQSGWLREVNIVNPSNAPISVALYDANGIYLLPNLQINPGGMISYNGSRWMNGGVTWVATAEGLSGYMRFQP